MTVMLAGHSAPVTVVAFSPDARLVATSAGDWDSPDFTVRLWRTNGDLIKELQGHMAPVRSLAWSPDGDLLASGSLDHSIRLWRPDGVLATNWHVPDEVVALAWSPDGSILASASAPVLNPVVRLWGRDGSLLHVLSTQYSGGKFYNLAWSPYGKFLLGGAIDYKVWRADGTEVFHLKECSHCTPAWAAAWSPDGTRWAIGNESGMIAIYDVQGHALARLQNEKGNVDALAWSPDGEILAGGDGVNLWRADGTHVATHASFGRVNGIVWSQDGRLLASESTAGGVRVYAQDGKLLSTFSGGVVAVTWTGDNTLLAAEPVANTISLVELTAGRPQP